MPNKDGTGPDGKGPKKKNQGAPVPKKGGSGGPGDGTGRKGKKRNPAPASE